MRPTFADFKSDVKVKLCDPSTTRAIPERLFDEVHLVKRFDIN